jgi:hypothetical protein
MKLVPLAHEKKSNHIKMIITTEQFNTLAQNVINEQEQGTIKKSYMIKANSNAQKK